MKKILMFLVFIFPLIASSNLKKATYFPENQWIELKFNLWTKNHCFELDTDKNYEYQIVVSDRKNKIYGEPSTNIGVKISDNEKNTYEKNKNFQGNGKVFIEFTSTKKIGKAYFHVYSRLINPERENIYDKVKDVPKIQEFNENPLKDIKK